MLDIKRIKQLADRLDFSSERLIEIADSTEDYCKELLAIDPSKPEKPGREILSVGGHLRVIQDRLLRRILTRRLKPSPHSHGGVPGRNIKSNLAEHIHSVFALTTDISNFYPSIGHQRVFKLFQRLGCTGNVARILTKLCTIDGHLALGLVTSPFLAEQVMIPLDRRISAVCTAAGLTYTRYVDDLTVSGEFNFGDSGIEATITEILADHGFTIQRGKTGSGRLEGEIAVTKLVVRNGHPDVRSEYLAELIRQIDEARNLAKDQAFIGPYFSRGQILGRVQFVCWINPGRRSQLYAKVKSVNWAAVEEQAKRRGYVKSVVRLVKR